MDEKYWIRRWQENQIGWHQREVEPLLAKYASRLPRGPKLVPLCGKSRDVAWLAEQGEQVFGVELSAQACADFFLETGRTPTIERRGEFEVYQSGRITIFRGDFFALPAAWLPPLSAIYDRAALIALSPESRPRYVARVTEFLPPGGAMLLIAIDDPANPTDGPPFSVGFEEVTRLYATQFDVERLEDESAEDVRRPAMREAAYLLRRKENG